jgi:hypothetical protein
VNPAGAERVEHRIGDGCTGTDRASFAAAFYAEGVMRTGCPFVRANDETGYIVSAGEAIVVEGAGNKLALIVIDAVFHQRLSDTLDKPAMNLALDDHRIDDFAEIVDIAWKAAQLHHARFRVDFDLGDVAAVRIGEVLRVVKRCFVQTRLQLVDRIVVWNIGGQRDVADAQFAVGAGNTECTGIELDIVNRGFEEMGGDLFAFSTTLSIALTMAEPPTASERDP